MIIEAYIWAFSKAAAGARQAGLVYEIAGIAGRFRRHQESWETHLNNSRKLIAEQIALADLNEPILVLGAGLGLDLPLDALNHHPSGALLCDAVETPTMRQKLKKYPNLSFEIIDLTGLLAPFWADNNSDSIRPPACAPIPLTGYSLAISCNILSQLPLPFAKSPPESDTEIRLTAAIQHAHMTALNVMDCPALIITDYERIDTIGGDTQNIISAAPQLFPEEPLKIWDWEIAPKGELGKDQSVSLKVGAWLLGG